MPDERYPSPTGRFVFRISAWEARMSHWIESFALVEAATGAVVFAPGDSNWSLDGAEWTGDAAVTMRLRKYPGDHSPSSFEVKLDGAARTAEIEGGAAVPLGKLEDALETAYRRARKV